MFCSMLLFLVEINEGLMRLRQEISAKHSPTLCLSRMQRSQSSYRCFKMTHTQTQSCIRDLFSSDSKEYIFINKNILIKCGSVHLNLLWRDHGLCCELDSSMPHTILMPAMVNLSKGLLFGIN